MDNKTKSFVSDRGLSQSGTNDVDDSSLELSPETLSISSQIEFSKNIRKRCYIKDRILSYIMTCYRCDKEFASKAMLDYHQKQAVCCKGQFCPIKSFECRFCHKKFTSNQSLQYHQDNLVCVKQNRRCKFCDKTLSSLRNFRQHQCKIKKEEIEKFRDYNPNLSITAMEHLLDERRELRGLLLLEPKASKDFDAEHPWYHQHYWNSLCERCGCVRKQVGHLVSCKI